MISVMLDDVVQPYKSFVFSGGELQVKFLDLKPFENLDEDADNWRPDTKEVTIRADLRSAHDIIELIMLTDAVRRLVRDVQIHLECPYFPYARQDRVCVPGEAFSLDAIGDLITAQRYASITVWDVHSQITIDVLEAGSNSNQIINIQAVDLIPPEIMTESTILIIPDKGAKDRVAACAKRFGLPMVQADKIRDPNTGIITGTKVDWDLPVGDNDFLVVDDICDGGMTFIELAKVLRPLTTGKIKLWVTHGIFSKGFEVFAGLIDEIYTANCFHDVVPDFVHVGFNPNYNNN